MSEHIESRIQQTLNEIEELKKVLAQGIAIAGAARAIVSDMIENSGGLKPHSDWYLQSVRNTFTTCVDGGKRTLFSLETDIEWLHTFSEVQAS